MRQVMHIISRSYISASHDKSSNELLPGILQLPARARSLIAGLILTKYGAVPHIVTLSYKHYSLFWSTTGASAMGLCLLWTRCLHPSLLTKGLEISWVLSETLVIWYCLVEFLPVVVLEHLQHSCLFAIRSNFLQPRRGRFSRSACN